MVPGQRHAPVHPEPVAVCLNLQQTNFRPISRFISEMIHDRAIVTISNNLYAMYGTVPFSVTLSDPYNPDFKVAVFSVSNNSTMVQYSRFKFGTLIDISKYTSPRVKIDRRKGRRLGHMTPFKFGH